MLADYQNYKVEYITKRWCYPLIPEILCKEFSLENKKLPLFNLGQFSILKGNLVEIYWAYQGEVWDKFYNHYKDNIPIIEEEITKGIQKARTTLTSNSYKNLIYYCELIGLAMRVSAVIRGIDAALQPKISSFLSEHEISLAVMFDEEPETSKEETDLLKLSINKPKGKELEISLRNIYDKYKWIAYGLYNEEPISFKDYILKFKEIRNPEKLLKDKEKLKKDSILERDKLISKLDKEQKDIIKIAQQSSYLKDLNKLFMTTCSGLSKEPFINLAKKYNISVEKASNLFSDEILKIIDGEKVDFSKIPERNRELLFIGLPKEFKVLSGKEAQEFEALYLKKDISKTMKGRVASKGQAQGRVKVVLGRHDFDKIEKGDILVVSNTTPDFVPIMKKAAAILAEEGGLTAHVSVVSREFGIPCIVGLSHITQKLKDNQVVKVDANLGIVTLI
ncbi:MAG: PEP-utilizing enzyme [Nanoarchaeota archaeon]|nr:PEP-utilizing enzyme [Nanoarchaeota archaeon]